MNYDMFHAAPKLQRKIIANNNFTYRNLIDVFDELSLISNSKILDYGSGVGTIDFYLAAKGFDVVGLEISGKARDISKKSSEAIGVSNKTHLFNINKQLSCRFDVIICSEVIEHVQSDYRLLKKFYGLLKNKGYLIITTPSINAPLFRLNLLNEFDKKVGHLRRYNANRLSNNLRNIGFNIISIRKEEGILRNSLFVFPRFNWVVRFLKGPLSDLVAIIDKFMVKLFGESNLIILSQKP